MAESKNENQAIRVLVPILTCLVLFSRFLPISISESALVSTISLPMNLLLTASAVWIFINARFMDGMFVAYLFFLVVRLLSNLINGLALFSSVWTFILSVSFYILIRWSATNDWSLFLKSVFFFFTVIILINLIFMVEEPEGAFLDSENKVVHFVGNRNSIIMYGICPVLVSYLDLFETEIPKRAVPWALIWSLLFFSLSIERSVTGIVGLSVLLIFLLFLNKQPFRGFCNLIVYIAINVFVFITFVKNQFEGALFTKILGLVGKKTTFSGRTSVWKDYIYVIPEELLIGHGSLSKPELEVLFDGTISQSMPHAHNIYLNVTFQTGLIGLVLFFLIFLVAVTHFREIEKKKVRYAFEAFLGVLMLMSQFEAYNMELYYLIAFIMYLYATKDGGKNHEQLLLA